MSWFFRKQPECPVPNETRQWIDSKLTWLTEQFGTRHLLVHETVLPTATFFPEPVQPDLASLHRLTLQLCELMGVPPLKIELQTYDPKKPMGETDSAAGLPVVPDDLSGTFDIWLDESYLSDPIAVTAELARELGYIVLVRHGAVDRHAEGLEPLLDLWTLFRGLGVLAANTALQNSAWSDGHWAYWKIRRTSSLSLNVWGYALALYALARKTPKPEWVCHLRPDVQKAFDQSLRYIEESGDCDFRLALP